MTTTSKHIERRFHQVLDSFRTGAVRTDSDALRELAELSWAMEDAPARPQLVARLTLTRADQSRIIIEVYENATFASFYHFFAQTGNKRSTKRHLRKGCRREGMNLDAIAITWKMREAKDNPITDIKIRILQRRAYRKLISARPDELGLTKMSRLPIYSPVARSFSPSGSLGGGRSA